MSAAGPWRVIRRFPVVGSAAKIAAALAELPRTLERLAGAMQSLDRLADLDETLRVLGTFETSLAGIASIADSVERLAGSVASLPELTQAAAALPMLAEHAGSLPALTANAAALPELVLRVAAVELMVSRIMGDLDTLRPAVDNLTTAATDLQRAVGPIGRIAGRLPGSRHRTPEGAQTEHGRPTVAGEGERPAA